MTAANASSSRGVRLLVRGGITLIALLLAAGTLVGAYMIGGNVQPPPREPVEPLVVITQRVQIDDGYTVSRAYTGRIEPRRRSEVGFELQGKLTALLADDGDRVAEGAALAQLDTQRLQARLEELQAARRQSHAQAELEQIALTDTQRLFQRDAATRRQLDEARQRYEAAVAAVERSSRQIDSVRVDLAKSTLVAPFDAIIARRLVDEGQVVGPQSPIFELHDVAAPEARVGVPEATADGIAIESTHRLRVNGGTFAADVVDRLPTMQRTTRTVEVLLRLREPAPSLRQNALATLSIDRPMPGRGVWLPIGALTESTRGLWACFVAEPMDEASGNATHRVQRRQVQILHSAERGVFVAGDLRDGERVVIDGLHRLVDGQPVRLRDEAPPTSQPAATTSPAVAIGDAR